MEGNFRRTALTLLLFILSLAVPPAARAWNRAGHMVIGAMTYYELQRTSPASLKAVIEALKYHPAYGEWQSSGARGSDLRLFMYASAWPDTLPRESKDNCLECKYGNVVYGREGNVSTRKVGDWEGEHLLNALSRSIHTPQYGVYGRECTRDENQCRAIALSWVLFLFAEMHQPVHVVSLSPYARSGDTNSSNHFYVRASSRRVNLHKYWDDLLLATPDAGFFTPGSADAGRAVSKARELMAKYNGSVVVRDWGLLEEAEYERWMSRDLVYIAREFVYSVPLRTSGGPGATLPSGYASKARRIAERLAVAASRRLSTLLQTYPSWPASQGAVASVVPSYSPESSATETAQQPAAAQSETGARVSKAERAAQRNLERRKGELRVIREPGTRGVVSGYDPAQVRSAVEQTKAELISSLKGRELAGTRAAIAKLDPLSGNLQFETTSNGWVVVTTESTAQAFNTFSAQLAYLKEGKRSVELKIVSTPGKANFYIYTESEEESRESKTERKPLDVVSTDGGEMVRYRGRYYYVITKDGYKQKEFLLNLWDVKGAKFALDCSLYTNDEKDGPEACLVKAVEDNR
jgi:hypothetical protein